MTSAKNIIVLSSILAAAAASKGGYRGFNDVHEMPIARSDMTATLFDSKPFFATARIYIVGGCAADQACPTGAAAGGWCSTCPNVTARCDFYAPADNTWGTCIDAPRGRYRHAAVNFQDKLYLFGGRDVADAVIKPVDVFNPQTNTWASTPYVWAAAVSDLGAFTSGSFIYIVGGWNAGYTPVATFTKYDPATNSVTALAVMPGGGRGDIGVISVPDHSKGHRHYAVGGFSADTCNPLTTTEEYDIGTSAWITRKPLALARGDLALGVINDHMFAIAGETKDTDCVSGQPGTSIPVTDVERFDSKGPLGKWVVEENVPAGRFRFVAASYQHRIYLFGGQGPLNTTTKPDPTHHVLKTTMLYVPQSVADADALAPEEIAGIVFAGLAFLGLIIFAGASYLAYLKYYGYQEQPDTPGDDDLDKTEAGQATLPLEAPTSPATDDPVGVHVDATRETAKV